MGARKLSYKTLYCIRSYNESSNGGNSYTTQFRQYDPRLGRWKSLDPLAGKFPNQSPFCAFNNNPIYFVDPLGLEGEGPGDGDKKKKGNGFWKKRDKNGDLTNEDADTRQLPDVTVNVPDSDKGGKSTGSKPKSNESKTGDDSKPSDPDKYKEKRNYKINPYNAKDKGSWTFSVGNNPFIPGKNYSLNRLTQTDPSYEAGNGFGVTMIATQGIIPYSTTIRDWDELSESNHSFGVTYSPPNTNFAFGGLYTKQKIRPFDNSPFGLEAPASLTYNISYRIGYAVGDFNFGVTPEIGIGQTIATLRYDGSGVSSIKSVGMSSAVNVMFDISYRHISYYMRAQTTYFYISPQKYGNFGVDKAHTYGIALITVGVSYTINSSK